MSAKPRPAAVACLGLALVQHLAAQTYPFRTIGRDEGLTSTFVHAIAQDSKGYLWIGTGDGAARFDGRQARMFTRADGLAEDPVSALLAASDGGLWIGHNEGGLSHWRNGRLEALDLKGLSTSTITAIVEDPEDRVFITTLNNGLFHVNAEGGVVKISSVDEPAIWYALLRTADGSLIAGRSDGLRLFREARGGGLQADAALDALTTLPVTALCTIGDKVFAGTDGEGVFSFQWSNGATSAVETLLLPDLVAAQVKDLVADLDGHLIVATFGQGAFELSFLDNGDIASAVRYNGSNGLGSDNVSAAFVDRENGLWLSRFSEGVAMRLDRAVTQYAVTGEASMDITSLGVRGNDMLLGSTSAVLVVSGASGAVIDTIGIENGLPEDVVTAIQCSSDGRTWIGTARSGLYAAGSGGNCSPFVLGSDHLSMHVHGIAARGDEIWVATGNGIYVVEPEGTRHLTTLTGLPHNSVNALFTDRGGQMWIGCNNGGAALFNEAGLQRVEAIGASAAHHITGITQDAMGAIWFATQGGGVLRVMADKVERLGTEAGLASEFVTALTADAQGHIWTAHRGAICSIDVNDGRVRSYDRQLGMSDERKVNTLALDERGQLWVGTADGAIYYDPGMEQPVITPPPVDLLGIKAHDRDLDLQADVTLDPDVYRMDFTFLGISLKDPAAITYRYKLEGHDLDWSTTSSPFANYQRVEDGTYTFRVQACSGPACSGEVRSTTLTILAPIWQRGWFIALAVGALAALTYTIVMARLRNQRHRQRVLEVKLDERTREVEARTAEITRKNKDITDSITYARRIQQAALPSEQQLRDHFPRSFIFHQPRDIVSGDFYWFRRFDDKFLLACADCTGHGVPGAFMSMIGSLLLRDISGNKSVNSPDEVLQQLDSELRSVLQYQDAGQRSNDGMDISVCEIDFHTHQLRASCAMHDLILCRDGELTRIKGERSSIGGIQRNGQPNTFGRIEHQLRRGDRIYMFSDGVPDQFGGPKGRKLKVSGVIDVVQQLCHLPMAEQALRFREEFLRWMHGHDQLDDVLFIGIEV